MKTTIPILISFFMILPGISETQTTADVNDIFYSSSHLPADLIQAGSHTHIFNVLSDTRDNPVNTGTMPELYMNSSEKEIEANPPIENWMTSPESWNHNTTGKVSDSPDSFFLSKDYIYDESDPYIEKWMTEPKAWSEKK